MYRALIASFTIVSLLFTPVLQATECQNPFAGKATQFQLFEQLSCTKKTSPVVLQIATVNGTISSQNPYLSPKCDEQSPMFELFNGSFVVDYSGSLANAHASKIHVSATCDGSRLFMIDREPLLLTLPSGDKVNTSVRVYAEDIHQTLIAYGRTDEDDDDSLVLRTPDTNIAATATKVFKQENCSATWTVNNTVGDQLTATIMAFALTLKDNTEFSCTPSPPPSVYGGISTGTAIGIGIAIGASVMAALETAVVCYCRHRPSYQKLME